MCGINLRRSLASSAILAVTIGMSQLMPAHGSPAPVPLMPPQQPAAASSSGPQFQTTPEQQGDWLLNHRQYQAAVEAYKQALPESATVWNKMAIAYQLLFDNSDSERCYKAALRLDSSQASILNNLGTLYAAMKNHRLAERYYRKALKLDPTSAVFIKNLGTDFLDRGQYDKGGKLYAEALALDPDIFNSNSALRIDSPSSAENRGAINYYMAKSCARAGLTDRAIEFLRKALNDGFTDAKKIGADNEFASLRGVPAFEKLLADQRVQ
jgi:tetratricopeptide (TPR) repeat protein